mmetsp:Transcript_28540/g.59868  ORF Transcript_28540/g.59868 Transcript_28540/m.59868 type:complete len:247 (-) Transcript_28540:328-1068(-)
MKSRNHRTTTPIPPAAAVITPMTFRQPPKSSKHYQHHCTATPPRPCLNKNQVPPTYQPQRRRYPKSHPNRWSNLNTTHSHPYTPRLRRHCHSSNLRVTFPTKVWWGIPQTIPVFATSVKKGSRRTPHSKIRAGKAKTTKEMKPETRQRTNATVTTTTTTTTSHSPPLFSNIKPFPPRACCLRFPLARASSFILRRRNRNGVRVVEAVTGVALLVNPGRRDHRPTFKCILSASVRNHFINRTPKWTL